MKILVTGGAGFIGSAFVRYMVREYADLELITYDSLTYAGNLENLKEVENADNHSFIKGDIGDLKAAEAALEGVDVVVNFAAESHNDRAILDPGAFVRTNVLGTQIFAEAALRKGVKRFHHISTCEVFGDLALDAKDQFIEESPFQPRTPYNASKAAANHVVMAYYHTFGLPVTISHCCNNYGPFQFPEKLIPLFATNAIENKELPMFASFNNRREWIHADDHASAVDVILQKGTVGETYNIGTGVEKSVKEIADTILKVLQKSQSLIKIVPDRKGHDRRYLLDSSKLRKLGWKPEIGFEEGMNETIEWYGSNRSWWERVKSGEYTNYYENYYKKVL